MADGAVPSDLSPGGQAALEALAEDELRAALQTLGMDGHEPHVLARVLRHVGNDVALAVDWIMENGDELASWTSEPQLPSEPAGDATAAAADAADASGAGQRGATVGAGTRIITADGKQGSVARVHDDGAFDLHLDQPFSPRLRVQRTDFTVDFLAPAPPGAGTDVLMRETLSSDLRGSSLSGDDDMDHGGDGLSSSLSPPSAEQELAASIADHALASAGVPPTMAMDIHYQDDIGEDDMEEDEHGEGEQETDLARLLSHLREFSELASMVSLQTTAQQGQQGAANGVSSATAQTGPVLAVGDYVVLAPGAARTSDGSRGPLRRGDVGEVLQVGESHVCVRMLSSRPSPSPPVGAPPGARVALAGAPGLAGMLALGGALGGALVGALPPGGAGGEFVSRLWWYSNSSLVLAPAKDAAEAVAGAAAASEADPARDCEVLRAPLKDVSATAATVRRLSSRASGMGAERNRKADAGLVKCCHDHTLLEALAEGLAVCCRTGRSGGGPTSAATTLDSLLRLAEAVASAVFLRDPAAQEQDERKTPTVGDMVKFKTDPAAQGSDEGLVTDDLGFGRLCVLSTVSRVAHDLDCSAASVSKRSQSASGPEVRVATGVLSYLNELLISRAVPLGDLSIVQRVLADGAHVEHADGDGNTALLLSIDKRASIDLVTVLVQHGAAVNTRNFAGRSALTAAVEKDLPMHVKLLLEKGANPETVSEESLDKCSKEVRLMIEAKRAAASTTTSPVVPDLDLVVARQEVQRKFLKRLLPTMLRMPGMAPAGLVPATERALAVAVLLVLEHIPEETRHLITESVAAGTLALAEDLLIDGTSQDTLLSLRLVQALVKTCSPHANLVLRYYVQPIICDLAQEKGALYEKLALQPDINITLAKQPTVALLSKVVPSAEASAQGVVLLARRVQEMLSPPNEAVSAAVTRSNNNACSGANCVSSNTDFKVGNHATLSTRLAIGEASALEELHDLLLQGEVLTSKQLVDTGLLDALLAFLEPPDAVLHAQRFELFWKTLTKIPQDAVGNAATPALWALLRRIQKVISVHESVQVPVQLGTTMALGVDLGMRALLEPHRVELVSLAKVESATATAVAAAETLNASVAMTDGDRAGASDTGCTDCVAVERSAFRAEVGGLGRQEIADAEGSAVSQVHTVDVDGTAVQDVQAPCTAERSFSSGSASEGREHVAGGASNRGGDAAPSSQEFDPTLAGSTRETRAAATEAHESTRVWEAASTKSEEEAKGMNALSVLVEPLVSVMQLSSHVLRLSDINDVGYEAYCQGLVGLMIFDRPRVLLAEQAVSYRPAIVEGFRRVSSSGIGVHQLRYCAGVVLDDQGLPCSDSVQELRKEGEEARVEVVLAVRDYRLSRLRMLPCVYSEHATELSARAAAAWAEAAEEEERCYMIVITYPHEAVPMDIFIDSVMGAVLQALRQADPGQTPYGKQYGDEYDFPSRGFVDGQPEFQESLTRGLSESPFEAAVARGQTRREAQVLLSRLNGICEASIKVDRSKNFMPPLQQGSELNIGSRVQSKYGRHDSDSAFGTVIARGGRMATDSSATPKSSDRYSVVYDDGVVVEAVPCNSLRALAKRQQPVPPAPGRHLAVALGRAVAAPLLDDGPTNPAALSRAFKSFLRKGEEAVPVRYELAEPATNQAGPGGAPPTSQALPASGSSTHGTGAEAGTSGDARTHALAGHSSRVNVLGGLSCRDGREYFEDLELFPPPLLQVAYALDPRDPSAAAASTVAKLPQAWHPVALASQLRSLYQISNGGATARKTERDEYVDAIRCSAALEKGVHRFRLRLDQIAGEDHCNHVGFVAGDAYSGSALNSVDSCGLEVDSARILIDGRACTQISRRPAQGDVIVLQIDVDSGNFSCGVEGEALVSSYWACEKRPIFLALSFRRVGWQVTILSSPQSADHDTMSRKEQAAHDLALIHSSLGVLSPSITLFRAMLQVVKAGNEACTLASPATKKEGADTGGMQAGARGSVTPHAGNLSGGMLTRQPHRLVYQVRVDGLERWLRLFKGEPAQTADWSRELSGCIGDKAQVWLEERTSGADGQEAESMNAAAGTEQDSLQQLRSAGLSQHAGRATQLLSHIYRHANGSAASTLSDDAIDAAAAVERLPRISDLALVDAAAAASAAVAGEDGDTMDPSAVASGTNSSVLALPTGSGQAKLLADVPDALMNSKLSRKLSTVLNDVVSVASGCLPEWCQLLSSLCPFLFSFATREQLVKCAAFGTSQTIFWLQEQRVDPLLRRRLREAEATIGQMTEMTGDRVQRAYDRLLHAQEAIERQRIGKLRSDIARVTRDDRLITQAATLMDVHADVTRMLEVQFVDEHGFGWGVTQGFYTAVALELQRADDDLCLWRAAASVGDAHATSPGGWDAAEGVRSPTSGSGPSSPTEKHRAYLQVGAEGLFPRPMHPDDLQLPDVCARMRFLGRLIAKAFRDGFNVPLPLSPAFFGAALLGKRLTRAHLPLESSTGGLARSMANLLERFERVASGLGSAQARAARQAVLDGPCTLLVPQYTGPSLSVSDYVLAAEGEWPAFVDPAGFVTDPATGEPVALCAGGASRRMVPEEASLREWVDAVVALWLRDGVREQLEAFRAGVQDVMSVGALLRFSEVELQRMLCGHQQVVWTAYLGGDWLEGVVEPADEKKALLEHIAFVGYGASQPPISKLLVDEMVAMDNQRRTKFLDLVTANPRLPPGGLPQAGIKVAAARAGVRTVWAQTCVRTLYLPDYTSPQQLHEGLEEAYANAALGGFHEKNLGGF